MHQAAKKIRVAFIMPIVGPARGAWFPLLSKESDIDLHVFALHDTLPHRPGWKSTVDAGYEVEVVRTYTLSHKRKFAGSGDIDKGAHFIPVDLMKRLFRFKPDVAVVTNAMELLQALPLKLAIGTRIILALEDTPLFYSRLGRLRRVFKAFVYRRADHFCAHSSQAMSLLKNLHVRNDRITFTPWAVDNNRFARDSIAADRDEVQQTLGLQGIAFITVGALIPRKGIDLLIEAWKRLCSKPNPGVDLLIVGDGPQRSRLQAMAQEYALDNIHFIGHVNQQTLASCYRAADVFILPTLEDIWGFVVSEAMAVGLPVLCSRYSGCSDDLVEDGRNGFVFDPLDPDDFDAALEKVLVDVDAMQRLGRQSLEIIGKFTIERSVDALAGAIRQVAARWEKDNALPT